MIDKNSFDWLPVWLKPRWAFVVLVVVFIGDWRAGLFMLALWFIWLIGWNFIVKPNL